MNLELLVRAPVGLLPVMMFLIALLYMDSYKLVGLKTVLWVIAAGGVCTLLAYFANGVAAEILGFEFTYFTRYVAPVIEEGLKALLGVRRLHQLLQVHAVEFPVRARGRKPARGEHGALGEAQR